MIKKSTHPFYERLSLVLIGLIALGYLIVLGKEVLDPLIFGFLFAILLLPISNFLEKKLAFPAFAVIAHLHYIASGVHRWYHISCWFADLEPCQRLADAQKPGDAVIK